jgi:hypothetical protein
MASTAGASLIRGNRNSRLSPGFALNKFSYLSRVTPQREYDMPIVYEVMDGPSDLTKDAI